MGEHCYVPRRPLGTHAYVLSRSGARKLIRRAFYASGHLDCVIWGIRELKLLMCHPMLAYQDMSSVSTIGSAWGIENLLPDTLMVDNYSGVSVKWALNEQLLRIGNFILTIGRTLTVLVLGNILGIALHEKFPWIIPMNSVVTALFGYFFVLCISQPEKKLRDKRNFTY